MSKPMYSDGCPNQELSNNTTFRRFGAGETVPLTHSKYTEYYCSRLEIRLVIVHVNIRHSTARKLGMDFFIQRDIVAPA